MDANIDLDLLESLTGCGSLDELHRTCRDVSGKLGFEHFLYGVRVNVSATRPYQFIFSGYPKQWWGHYVERGYQNSDPLVRHCARRVVPLVWREEVFESEDARQLMNEATEFGLVSGITFPVRGASGEAALFSLSSGLPYEATRRHIAESVGRMQLLACYLHEAIHRLVLTKEAVPQRSAGLSAREKQCLEWAADGKTTWEIAHILKLSQSTVNFHINNAASKMGAANRRQAVARAISMGLIAP